MSISWFTTSNNCDQKRYSHFTLKSERVCCNKHIIPLLFSGNLNDAVPECPRVNVTFDPSYYFVMFLKKTNRQGVYEIEYKPNKGTEISDLLDELSINCGLELSGDSM